eukprot:2171565-Pyramimonas_sp.AAC.1
MWSPSPPRRRLASGPCNIDSPILLSKAVVGCIPPELAVLQFTYDAAPSSIRNLSLHHHRQAVIGPPFIFCEGEYARAFVSLSSVTWGTVR